MKRSAAQAGFPAESQVVRMEVHLPADRCTRYQPMCIDLTCHSSDSIDHVKKILHPQLPCFQLHQSGRHISFTEPITTLRTVEPVQFIRVAPDYRE